MIEGYDASNPKHIRIARKEAKLRDAQDREVIVELMARTNGRAWVLGILERCHIFANPFVGLDAKTNFNCGEHNVGIQIFNQIVRCAPDDYVRMMKERNERDAARSADAESKRSENRDGGVEASGASREPESEFEPGGDEAAGEEGRPN